MRLRRSLALLTAGLLTVALTGCSLLDDLADGQRITTGRVQVWDALRILVEDLQRLGQVDAARYDYDTLDVESGPGVEVDLGSSEYDDWLEVIRMIDAAADEDPLRELAVRVALASDRLQGSYDTLGGSGWFGRDILQTATDVHAVFPGASVHVTGVEQTAVLSVNVPASAERVLQQLAGDGEARDAVAGLDAERVFMMVHASGLTLSGRPPSPEIAGWVAEALETGVPRTPVILDPESAPEYPTESVQVEVSTGATGDVMISLELRSGSELATGPAWERLTRVLTVPLPPEAGECVPLSVMYSWPGVVGNFPSISNSCVEWVDAGADLERPSLVELRDALTASGVDLDALGLRLS